VDRDVADRVRRLEDLDEIHRLKARYCRLSDRGYDTAGDSPEEVAALFADDGAWGDMRGHESIRRLFESFQATLPFAAHVAVNAEIELDGDTARGRWLGLVLLTDAAGDATWVVGTYDDAFVRTTNGWRIASLTFTTAGRFPAGPRVTMPPNG
jgi:hypothetical protein